MSGLSWMGRHDAARRASAALVDAACQSAGLVPPMPGLGMLMTEAQEQVFRAIFYGHDLDPTRGSVAVGDGSYDIRRRIFDHLDREALTRAAEAFHQ